jgi:hypothetical protein
MFKDEAGRGEESGGKPPPSKSGKARDSGKAVKTGIEAEDLFDSVPLHDGEVHGITRGHFLVPHHNLFRSLGRGPVYGQHFIGDTK